MRSEHIYLTTRSLIDSIASPAVALAVVDSSSRPLTLVMKAPKFSFYFAFILLAFALALARAQDCSQVTTCVECLAVDDCGAWSEGTCLESCSAIADASCYTTNTFPNKTVEEACQAAADATVDAELCAEQTDCGECVGTTLSDGNTTCQWFQDGGYCGSACDMNGCGETTCTDPCEGLSCQDCLDGGASCGWIPLAGCLSGCSVIDTTCFLAKEYDASEVCDDVTENSDTPSSDSSSARRFVPFAVSTVLGSIASAALY